MPAISRRAAASDHPFVVRDRNALRSPCRAYSSVEAVQHAAVGAHQRKGVEDANRARVLIEQLADVGLAQPAVDAAADLDADRVRDDRRAADPPREVDLTEAAFAEQPLDAVAEAGLRAGDDFRRDEQKAAAIGAAAASRPDGSGGRGRGVLRHTGEQ